MRGPQENGDSSEGAFQKMRALFGYVAEMRLIPRRKGNQGGGNFKEALHYRHTLNRRDDGSAGEKGKRSEGLSEEQHPRVSVFVLKAPIARWHTREKKHTDVTGRDSRGGKKLGESFKDYAM